MLSIEEALAECRKAIAPVREEWVPTAEAVGRLLAQDVAAPIDLPPWNNSAMDGFAVCASDFPPPEKGGDDCAHDALPTHGTGVVLEVLETIAAGAAPVHTVRAGCCSRIMTGAPLPAGADAVVMLEYAVEQSDGRVALNGGARAGQHVRRRGDDVATGAVVLDRGDELTAAGVGLCAALGLTQVAVAQRPTVGIVSTGDEIVEPGKPLGPGQIYSSNSVTLAAMVRAAGAIPVDCGNAPDDLEAIRAAFGRAVACDFVLSTGGVSVGDFDLVKQAMQEDGAQMEFWKVRMKPGKPLAFGSIAGTPVFGLPGNPVSCVVNFLQFVRPVLRESMGDRTPYLPVVMAELTAPVQKKAGRNELVRVRLSWSGEQLLARPLTGQGSHMIAAMAQAHGFALLSAESTGAGAGSTLGVQVFDPTFGSRDDAGYRW